MPYLRSYSPLFCLSGIVLTYVAIVLTSFLDQLLITAWNPMENNAVLQNFSILNQSLMILLKLMLEFNIVDVVFHLGCLPLLLVTSSLGFLIPPVDRTGLVSFNWAGPGNNVIIFCFVMNISSLLQSLMQVKHLLNLYPACTSNKKNTTLWNS